MRSIACTPPRESTKPRQPFAPAFPNGSRGKGTGIVATRTPCTSERRRMSASPKGQLPSRAQRTNDGRRRERARLAPSERPTADLRYDGTKSGLNLVVSQELLSRVPADARSAVCTVGMRSPQTRLRSRSSNSSRRHSHCCNLFTINEQYNVASEGVVASAALPRRATVADGSQIGAPKAPSFVVPRLVGTILAKRAPSDRPFG